jgi:hypothetical protein
VHDHVPIAQFLAGHRAGQPGLVHAAVGRDLDHRRGDHDHGGRVDRAERAQERQVQVVSVLVRAEQQGDIG